MKLFQKEKGKMKDDWKLRVIGASQGAGDAMAVHKLLDTTPIDDFGTYLRDAWNFDYSYVCCGPYCPEATMQAYHRDGVVYYPCVVPLVIESMLDCHWNSEVRWTRWKYKKSVSIQKNGGSSGSRNSNLYMAIKLWLQKT